MGKISREELLKIMDESEENGGIDLEQLYSNAKRKLGDTEPVPERITSHDVVMQKFDKISFSKVLATAIGGRTTKEFAAVAGLEFYAVLKYLELQCDLMPSDETLRAIAAHAENGIDYGDLVRAANGISAVNEAQRNEETIIPKEEEIPLYFDAINVKLFIGLLDYAKGTRSITAFANDANMRVTYLADLLEGKLKDVPAIGTLKCIAEGCTSGISYMDLVAALNKDYSNKWVAMINERIESTGKTSKEIVANSPLAQQSLKNIARNLDGILEQEGKPKATWEAFAEKDTTLDRYRNGDKTYHGIDTEAPTAMDCFSKDNKPKEIKDSDSPEVLALIKKLKELGIREDDYAKTKLGLMAYSEFLINNPALLNFRRFKSVLKKLVGYVDIRAGMPRYSKFLTTESLFYRVAGNNSTWNTWFQDVDTRKKPRYSRETNIISYMDNAIEYIFTFGDSRYYNAIEKLGVISKSQKLLIYILSGLLMLGYNEKQILFTLCRITEPERNWKMKPTRGYHKFSQEPSDFTEQCLEVIELLSQNTDLGSDSDNYKLVELARLMKAPSENLLNSSFESLMIKDIDSLRKELRKDRIKHEVSWVLNMQPNEMGYGSYRTKEKFDKAFQEYLGYFKESEPNVCNNLELAYNKGDYFEALRHLEQLEHIGSSDNHVFYEKLNAATQQLPGKKLFTPGESEEMNNRGEIERICWEFRFGKPY